MRVKQLPVPAAVKTTWTRITASRLTASFFILALLHCTVQVIFQVMAFKTNEYAGNFLSNIIEESGIMGNWAVLVQNGELRLCGPEDKGKDIMECEVVWTGQLGAALDRNGTSEIPTSSSTSAIAAPTVAPQLSLSSTSSVPAASTRVSGDDDDDEDDDNERDDDDRDVETNEVTTTVFEFEIVEPTSVAQANPVATTASERRVKRDSGVFAIQAVNGSVTGVQVDSIIHEGNPAQVDMKCVEMLIWPNQMIRNTKREDITFTAFQIWVFGMSFVAILHESIPHILAALLTHFLATIWSGYQIWNTSVFRKEFIRTTIDSKVCDGINLLPDYWPRRNAAEVAVCVVNAVSLLASIFFTWRLVKAFGWQTFKRIGASIEVNRIYKIMLTFSIGLQLAVFFVVTSMGLWLDFLLNTTLGQRAWNALMYKIIAIVVMAVMIPWFAMGWFAVRKEHKITMGAFLGLCVIMLAGWGGMFASNTFRWTFKDWAFFSAMSTASCALTLLTTVLGAVCLRNFDKGLKNFLSAKDPLPGDGFSRVNSDIEKAGIKVEFPTSLNPTYESAFGSKEKLISPVRGPLDHVPEYDQTTFGSQKSYGVRQPPIAVMTSLDRIPSNASAHSARSASDYARSPQDPFNRLDRRISNGSDRSGNSSSTASHAKTYVSAGSHHVPTATTMHHRDASDISGAAKRGWVIE